MTLPFGVPPASEAGHQPHSEGELRELLRESSREGLIERDEQELSEAALNLRDTRARDVMKSRGEIDFVLTTDSPRTIAERVIATGRTRLPLCKPEGGLDAAVGTVHAKDLLHDEFDQDRPELVSEHDGRLWLDGQTPVRALARRFGAELEEHYETTVSGYLSEHLGRVPDVGEVIELNGYRVEIIAVDETRITKVAVAPNPARQRTRPGETLTTG